MLHHERRVPGARNKDLREAGAADLRTLCRIHAGAPGLADHKIKFPDLISTTFRKICPLWVSGRKPEFPVKNPTRT